MMKSSAMAYYSALFILIISFSCKKDPQLPNQEELITTLQYTLTPVGGGYSVVYEFKDLDGDGGNPPLITSTGINGGDSLVAGVTYIGIIELLNESTSPTINITAEVLDEAEEHQFFFGLNGLHAVVDYDDQDADGFPIGLTTQFTTAGPGVGTIVITLRHQPDKTAAGVSEGDIDNAGGESDIEVTFPVLII